MTRLEIQREIEQLDAKLDKAIELGRRARATRYLGEIAELEEDLSVMPHEFRIPEFAAPDDQRRWDWEGKHESRPHIA